MSLLNPFRHGHYLNLKTNVELCQVQPDEGLGLRRQHGPSYGLQRLRLVVCRGVCHFRDLGCSSTIVSTQKAEHNS